MTLPSPKFACHFRKGAPPPGAVLRTPFLRRRQIRGRKSTKLTTSRSYWFARIHFVEFLNIKLRHFSIDTNALASHLVFHNRISKEPSQCSIIMHDGMSVICSQFILTRPIELLRFLDYVT